MRLTPPLFTMLLLVLAGCSPESTPVDDECSKSNNTDSCLSENDESAIPDDYIEDPGELTLDSISERPTGVINDKNQEALIEAGLEVAAIFSMSWFFTEELIPVKNAYNTIDCRSGSGYSQVLKNGPSNLHAYKTYSIERTTFSECSPTAGSYLEYLTLDGIATWEWRWDLNAFSITTKLSTDGFSVTSENSAFDGFVHSSTGSLLGRTFTNTDRTTVAFSYLSENIAKTGPGTFLFYTSAPRVEFDDLYESGSWIIEDSTGATIEFVVTGADPSSVMVTARGVGIGEFEL